MRYWIDSSGDIWSGPSVPNDTLHYARFEGHMSVLPYEPIWVLRRSLPPENAIEIASGQDAIGFAKVLRDTQRVKAERDALERELFAFADNYGGDCYADSVVRSALKTCSGSGAAETSGVDDVKDRLVRLRDQIDGMQPTPTNLAEALSAIAEICSHIVRHDATQNTVVRGSAV